MAPKVFSYPHPFTLESGITLARISPGLSCLWKAECRSIECGLDISCADGKQRSGRLVAGPGRRTGNLLDPEKYFLVCVNMPGSCYGSIGPLENNPATGQPYYHDFPFFTTRDMIRAYQPLRESLGIKKIKIGIGGSMGGQQLLEWAIEEPELFEHIVPIATNAFHSPWGKAFNASQRHCIELDPDWLERQPQAGIGE